MRSRRTLIIPALLLLAATHATTFLLARGGTRVPDESVRHSSYLMPAKSADRATAQGDMAGTSFTRRLRELEQSRLPRHDFELGREEIFRQWIRHDLRGAMDLLYGFEQRERYGSLAETLQKELATGIALQPRAVWDWLSSRRYGSASDELFGLWCKTLARAGQTDVLLECLCQPGAPRFVDDDAVSLLCRTIPPGAAAQLAALRKLIAPMPIRPESQCPAADYVLRMAAEAGADPVPFLTAEPREEIRSLFLEKWEMRELGNLPVAEQVQRLAALPEAFRAEATDAMVHHERGDTSVAVALINAMDAAGLMGDPAGKSAQDLAKSTLNWVTESGFTTSLDSIRILQTIRNDSLRRFALEDFGPLYNHREATPIQDCIDAVPAGPDRDAFISGVVWRADFTPEVREQLFNQIQAPQVAAEARRLFAERLEREAKTERMLKGGSEEEN